ncbi:hypothetical protein [Methanobrevibacter sp.]|uniref:hypothetical protein n=1 Tax=Methanobrevibacter sp. TaxID=66852 RepID=UPI0025CE8730|nr:hypothetical protein [Methanobrevibacter sp.]MBR4447460.1 hypothetical protein [Methanobrevibacter sp.]
MKIYVQKIAMIRPDVNPKNSNLNLDIDWSVEYWDTDKNQVRFNMILKSLHQFCVDFKIEGVVELYALEKFIQEDVSKLIFHKSCSILMDMISLTRESTHILSNPDNLSDFGSEHISSTLFN